MVKWNAHSRVLFILVGVGYNHAHFMCLFFNSSLFFSKTFIPAQAGIFLSFSPGIPAFAEMRLPLLLSAHLIVKIFIEQ